MSNKNIFNAQICHKKPVSWNSKCIARPLEIIAKLQILSTVRINLNQDPVDCIIDIICKKIY